MFDLAIKSNATVTPEGLREAVVLVKGGIIAGVVDTLDDFEVLQYVDAGNKILMPGVIDPHVHINEPGRTEWEGFDTATRSAIAGGITTVIDMPLNSSPVTTTKKALEIKQFAAKQQLHCDCGFWGGIVPGNETEIEGLANSGVIGFKAFLTHSGIDDFPNVTESSLRKAMPLIARVGLPLLVHCELSSADRQAQKINPRSYGQYLASRPADWEDKAIALIIRLCREYNCQVHIVHLSSANSVGQLLKAKEEGLPLSVETAQHYLYFNAEAIMDGQTQFKCAPPIRPRANNDLLWQALQGGCIDLVATDHSPAPPGLKQAESGDFTEAWGGIASLQFALPVLWTVAKRKNEGIVNVAKWLCEHPAKLIGQQNNKGKIAKGYNADLIVFDAEHKFLVAEHVIHHKHKLTPYLQEELYGTVNQTYLSGVKVYDNGTFTRLNTGKIITRR